MHIDAETIRILDDVQEGKRLTRTECAWLLHFPETSPEASLLRATSDFLSRRRFRDSGIIMGQIGIESAACPGKCRFCGFGEGHSLAVPHQMPIEEILQKADAFTKSRELHAVFLMTMHAFDCNHLLQTIRRVRAHIPDDIQIILNIGDFDRVQAQEFKAAGAGGAYHICRLREGADTAIAPGQRVATIRNIKDCGMDWYYCCEPIGPEHSPEELANQIFLGIEYGCVQHAAMRRVYFPTSPLAPMGQISELRLAQVVAAVTLAALQCPDTRSIAVHEPNLLGLTSGANALYAETGANPRDTHASALGPRGWDIGDCRRMLYESGFRNLLGAAGKAKTLTEFYKE